MRSYRDLGIRAKIALHLSAILLLFSTHLGITWWFLQRPFHHGPLLGTFLVGSFGAALFVIALLFISVDRHVARPLARLETEVQTIARGDLGESVSPIDVDDEIGTLSRSLEEMKAQLAATVREAEQFEQAIEHAGHAVYITDIDGTIEYVNPAFEAITKHDRDEAIGENPRILNAGYQSEAYYERLWETINDGGVWEEEFINQRATGELFYADQTIAPITGPDGEIDGFVAIMADRTDQRVLEQQTQVLSRILRHNIRTECNIIDGYAQEILRSDDPEERTTYGRRIRDRIERMVEVGSKADRAIRELEENSDRHSSGVCAAVEIVRDAMERRYPAATITTDLPDYEVDVPVHLRSVLEEILENAVEHNDRRTPKVTVSVSIEQESVSVTQSPTVRIDIDDNGPGIPEEERTVIEEGEETPLYHGSGIGLWMVYWRVTLAGGDIEIRERDTHGTRVTITLPRGSVSPFPRDAFEDQTGRAVHADRSDHDTPPDR